MQDDELLRYSRHIMLPEIEFAGQQRLKDSTALIIGLGGLGSISSQYLASSGVNHLILADFDQVELSNLSRQIIHHTKDIGKLKIVSAKEKLLNINPNIKVTLVENITDDLDKWVELSDIVLDGTDNFNSRFKINKFCITNKKPLISAAVIRFEGQVATFVGYKKDAPCYNCLYSNYTDNEEYTCSANGVLAPIVGIMGSLQATQAIKYILGIGEKQEGKLLVVNGLNLSFKDLILSKDKQCNSCSY